MTQEIMMIKMKRFCDKNEINILCQMQRLKLFVRKKINKKKEKEKKREKEKELISFIEDKR